jgi:ATP-dependent transcriptional regulator
VPAAERAALHGRAAAWLNGHGMIEQAARHAHAAGQHQTAYELAERCLHDAVKEGRLSAVLEWLDLLPADELERRPRLLLAAAWALALGERHKEAELQVQRVLASPNADAQLRYECALILSAAAYYADEIDRFVDLFTPWVEFVPAGDSWLAQIHANRLAARAILSGSPRRHAGSSWRSSGLKSAKGSATWCAGAITLSASATYGKDNSCLPRRCFVRHWRARKRTSAAAIRSRACLPRPARR